MALVQSANSHPIIVLDEPDTDGWVPFLIITHDPLNGATTMPLQEVNDVDPLFKKCNFSGEIVLDVQKVKIDDMYEPNDEFKHCLTISDDGLAILDQKKVVH